MKEFYQYKGSLACETASLNRPPTLVMSSSDGKLFFLHIDYALLEHIVNLGMIACFKA